MKTTAFLLMIMFVHFVNAEACKFGLGYGNSNSDCLSKETDALRRVASAKSICTSENSELRWNKNSKEPTWAWPALRVGETQATKGFLISSCESADLIVKYVYDNMDSTVEIGVTDAESGAIVFSESRSVSDLRSDTVRMATHWHDMVITARITTRASEEAARRAEEEQERRTQTEEHKRVCDAEANSIGRTITDALEVHKVPIAQEILDSVSKHNTQCQDVLNVESIQAAWKAEAEAKAAQENTAKQIAIKEKRETQLKSETASAFAEWKQRVISAPYVLPVDGWISATTLPNDPMYVVLPQAGLTSNCHFASDRSRSVLDCLGGLGRNDFTAIHQNQRWYLLKSKSVPDGEYAGTVKNNGNTICLRKVGCYRVLAEVRPEPTSLPDRFQVPPPDSAKTSYNNQEISFSYPRNWVLQEAKDKNGVVLSVSVATPEARLAKWITHGFVIGHVNNFPNSYPQTLDGAYDQFAKFQQDRGLGLTDPTAAPIGNGLGKVATYASASVLRAGESGWVAVVKDKGNGYFWMEMFYPSNDNGPLYEQTFREILRSVKFNQ